MQATASVRTVTERLYLRLDGDPLYAPETSVPAGTLREFAVASSLEAAVAHIVLHEEMLPAHAEVREHVVPDGSLHLVFAPGHARTPLRVAGPNLAPATLVMRGHVRALSVKLKPGAALALFGTSAHELAGRAVAWDELVAARERSLPEQLLEAGSEAAQLAVLARVLPAMFDAPDDAALRKLRHATQLLRGAHAASVRNTADTLGISERRLQQLFQAHFGLAPRAWRRLARIHDCLRLLRRRGDWSWACVAAECGFTDQPHLANEFRAICGLTPMQFVRRKEAGRAHALEV